jgi:queuine/archaeosine tRNA-ribosyltransferase
LKETHFNSGLKEKLGISGPLMVDSGGFALMMNPGSRWTIRDVSQFVDKIDGDIFVSLDHPPARQDQSNERLRKIALSAHNYRILYESFVSKIIMPVIHGRTMSEIELSIQLTYDVAQDPKWIGLGGIVPLLQHRIMSPEISRISPEGFIALSLAKIRSAFPRSKIHAFGAGGPLTFPAVFALGADSADSIGWRQAAGFGSIFLPLRSQRAVRWNKEKRPPRRLLDSSDFVQLMLCRCPICEERPSIRSRLAAFRSDFHNRSIHNAWVIIHQVGSWPNNRSGMKLLISNGNFGPAWAKAVDVISSV